MKGNRAMKRSRKLVSWGLGGVTVLLCAFFVSATLSAGAAKRSKHRASAKSEVDHEAPVQQLRPVEHSQANVAPPRDEATSRVEPMDAAAIEAPAWVQENYPIAFNYDGPVPDPAAQAEARRTRAATDAQTTPADLVLKEQKLLELFPNARERVEHGRAQRQAAAARFERTGNSAEQQALDTGAHLEE